ncbi:MAG: hypothetical protein HGA47_08465 [Zoogloea sp.]|nr:hypothetical protein [Zoogloea sp.]
MAAIGKLVATGVAPRELAAALRPRLAGLRVTVVDALDMRGETPVIRQPDCDVFLMAFDGHCWSMTTDPAAAAGIVLTEGSV